MKTSLLHIALAAALLPLARSAAGAQTYCRPANDLYAAVFRHQVVEVTTGLSEPWPTMRTRLNIPRKVENQVAFDTTEANCRKAAEAYDRELVRRGEPSRPRRVYVVRIEDLIAVSDPDDISREREWRRSMFFTDRYAYIGTFGT